MALANWPDGLPAIAGERSSFGIDALYEPGVTTKMSDGPPRSRVKQIYDIVPLAVMLHLELGQLPILRVFARDTLNRGSLRFNGSVVLEDLTIGTRVCKIEGPISIKPLGLKWTASMLVMVKDW